MERLFSNTLWFDVEQGVLKAMEAEINTWDGDQLLDTSIDDLCEHFVEKYRIDVPVLNRNEIIIDYEDTHIDLSGGIRHSIDDRNGSVQVQGIRIEITVPYTGNTAAFFSQPTSSSVNRPRAHVNHRKKHLILVIPGAYLEHDAVLQTINSTLDKIDAYLDALREDAAKLNGDLDLIARQCIEERCSRLSANRDLVKSLPFKLKQRSNSLRTHEVPKVRRKITPKSPQTSTQPYQSKLYLDEKNYEYILKVMENMTRVMELSPAAFSDMGEEVLRWHFLVQLNGHYVGQATGETFNYEGKTDILIRSAGKNIFIAECKYWGGPKKLTETIDQLLGYSSWRDTKVAVIIFNKNKNFTKVLEKIKLTTKEHPNCQRELERRSETSFRFIFSHRDDPNREMTLTVMAFDVPK